MKRRLKDFLAFLTVVAAIGAMAIFWLVLTQVLAVAIAVVVALVVMVAVNWSAGLIAGIITYAVLMKVFDYFEIFDMISSGKRRRPKKIASQAAEQTDAQRPGPNPS